MITSVKRAMNGEKGFTLIELLVVVAIIGILVAIAIPQFASYKKQANDGGSESDLRNMSVAMESYFVANDNYTGATIAELTTNYGMVTTKKVTTSAPVAGASASLASSWRATSYHTGGLVTYTWISDGGGMQ